MRHAISAERYGPQGQRMAAAIESCVHCGFCLPTCPTYAVLGEEMDSPRGRIMLMKGVLEGTLELDAALPYVDNCLGCQACETACPSGVAYGELITPFRDHAEHHRQRSLPDRVQRTMVLQTLPYPARFRLAARLGRSARPLARVLPPSTRAMLELLPTQLPTPEPLPELFPAEGSRRARVALLAGCAQQVLSPGIGAATLRVLARNGVETVVPRSQGCCGALPMHAGAAGQARQLARRNLAAFPSDVDAVVTNAAGCGSGMKEYELLFEGEPEHERATAMAAKVVDVATFLDRLGIAEVPAPGRPLKIAYHDACHLAHAQRERLAPRALLSAIPDVSVLTPAEWELCCGSAGIYNVEHPSVARELGERKAKNLAATGADLIAAGNIGCLVQITTELERLGHSLPALHTIQILDAAYRRELPGSHAATGA